MSLRDYNASDIAKIYCAVIREWKRVRAEVRLKSSPEVNEVLGDLLILFRLEGRTTDDLISWIEKPQPDFGDLTPKYVIEIHPERVVEYAKKELSVHWRMMGDSPLR